MTDDRTMPSAATSLVRNEACELIADEETKRTFARDFGQYFFNNLRPAGSGDGRGRCGKGRRARVDEACFRERALPRILLDRANASPM